MGNVRFPLDYGHDGKTEGRRESKRLMDETETTITEGYSVEIDKVIYKSLTLT